MVCSVRRVIDGASHGPVPWTNAKAQVGLLLAPTLTVVVGGVLAMWA